MTPEVKKRIEQIHQGIVPEGYTKTRSGITPTNWTPACLGDIYTERKEPGNESLPLLTVSIHSGVSDGELDEDELPKKVKRIEDKSQYKRAATGDLVFNMMRAWQGAIGTVRTEGMVSPAYIVAKPNGKVYPPFMDYYMKAPRMVGMINRQSYGVTDFRKRLYWDSFAPIPCVLPPVREQKKIAEILSTQDKAIELQERKIDELKRFKKGYLERMFPRKGQKVPEKRFPGFTDDWEQRKVSELFRVTRGYVLAATQTETTKTDEKPYPVYSSQTKDKGLMGYYKDYLYEDAITWTTDGANAGTVNYRAGKFYCTNVCGVLLSNEVKANQMIAEALNSVAKGYVSYVGNPKLMNNVMADIVIQIPTQAEEREQLSSFFAKLDNLITLHQRKLEEMKRQKKALMQLLLTGIVRVKA